MDHAERERLLDAFAATGLNSSAILILRAILSGPSSGAFVDRKAVAEAAGKSPQAVAVTLKRLIRLGLVERTSRRHFRIGRRVKIFVENQMVAG